MNTQNWKKVVRAAARILLACAIVSVQGASAQDSTAQGRPKPVAAQTSEKQPAPAPNANARIEEPQTETAQSIGAEKQSRAGGPQEGIKLHDHWTIEVRNPDGMLVTHREFENAYLPNYNLLPLILGRTLSVGLWEISLGGSACTVNASNPSASGCYIGEPSFPAVDSNNLSVSVPQSGTNVGSVNFSGTVTSGISGSVTRVETQVVLCAPSIASASCGISGDRDERRDFYTLFADQGC